MKTKTCRERLSKVLQERLDEIREAIKDEDKRDVYYESILAVAKRIVYDIQLSTGGPADGFKIIVDPESMEIEAIEYYFADWFDYASVSLTGKDFKIVEEMFYPLLETLEY